MNVKVFIVILIFINFTNGANVITRQNNLKREPLKISKNIKSRGELMENLFVVFDPSFLSYVWPKIKNGVHLNIGHNCWEDVSLFLRDLSEGRAWAYRAADASGRYQSGLFAGRRFWLGSKKQCLYLDDSYTFRSNQTWGEYYSADYLTTMLRREKFGGNVADWASLVQGDELMQRMVSTDNAAPFSLGYTALQIDLNVTKITLLKVYKITLGLCLPRTCLPEDVVSIINFSIMLNDNLKSNKTVSRAVKITSLRHVENYYDIKKDIGAVSLLLVTISLIILMIIATVIDLDLMKMKSRTSSFDLEPCNKRNVEENNQRAKESQRMEAEMLSAKNLSELKKAIREKGIPPSITLDVMTAEGITSCQRCGKYRKQCPNQMQKENNEPCPRVKYSSNASLTTEYKTENSVWKNLLLSFSLKHSWMRIFNTSMANKDLAMVHVLKIIAVLWIMFIHVSVIVSYIAENGGDLKDNAVFYVLCTGSLAFNTLFFVSGVFSAQHFFYLKSRYSAQELVSQSGNCGEMLQLVCFITNRAVRLLPPYLYTIFLTSVLSRVSRDTAVLSTPERDYDNCDWNWWRNILYLTNIYPKDEECMQVSWYLSTETQLHGVVSLACLLLALRRRRAAAALAFVVGLGATATDVISALDDPSERASSSFELYYTAVSRPWGGVSSYWLGALAGWLLYVVEGECSVTRLTSRCLWVWSVVCVVVSWSLVGCGWSWAPGARLAWPGALVWPVLMAATTYSGVTRGLLSSPLLAGVSRLSYTVLLCHGGVSRVLLLSTDTALCSHFSCILCYFAGCTLVSLLAALCLSLLLEMPSCCLLRRISDYTHR